MKAKSRRRLLISSIAMLLVAMIALGTATFAWFTTDTTITASGLNVKTTKASHLQLSNFSTDWTSNPLNYGQAGTKLLPSSSYDGTNWFYAGATSNTNGTAKAGTAKKLTYASTGNDNITSYAYVNQLNIKNAGEVDITNIKIKFQLADEKDGDGTALGNETTRYMRFAICPAKGRVYNADASTDYIGNANAQPTNAEAFRNGVYAYAADTANPITAITGSGTSQTITAASALAATDAGTSAVELTVGTGTLIGGASANYMIYLWFEGQDADCTDANQAHEIPDFTITVTGSSATS